MPRRYPDYHLNWSTKGRVPQIVPELEPILYDAIRRKAIELGARIHALNGWRDHVHLVVSIPPSVSVARFVGQVKGYSSRVVHKSRSCNTSDFEWQTDYEVESVSPRDLKRLILYVERQKEHHRRGEHW